MLPSPMAGGIGIVFMVISAAGDAEIVTAASCVFDGKTAVLCFSVIAVELRKCWFQTQLPASPRLARRSGVPFS